VKSVLTIPRNAHVARGSATNLRFLAANKLFVGIKRLPLARMLLSGYSGDFGRSPFFGQLSVKQRV